MYVGGNEQSSASLIADKIFEEELSKDYYYIKFKSDKELNLAYYGSGGISFDSPYSFNGDSLIIVSDYIEEGRLYLGKGSRKSLTKECGAFMFYGYRMKNGQKEDLNRDGITNDMDKMRITAMRDKFLTSNDVLSAMGYTSMSQLEAKDSVLIYNYTLQFLVDMNGDRIYTDADR